MRPGLVDLELQVDQKRDKNVAQLKDPLSILKSYNLEIQMGHNFETNKLDRSPWNTIGNQLIINLLILI